jgi:uncharacterized membrane protein
VAEAPRFLAVAFSTAGEAEDGLAALGKLAPDDAAHVRDAAVVVRTSRGRIELHQTRELAAGEGAVAGGAVGLVAGLLLGIPVGGALAGLLVGGGWGLRDTGIPDDRLREVGRGLRPGHAVLSVLVDEPGLPAVRDALSGYGDVVEADLSPAGP